MALEYRKKAKFNVSGMTCATCATTIEKSLVNLNSVTMAQVNLGNESVIVEYNPSKLKFSDLNKAIKDAGYQVINEKITLKIGGMTCAACVKTIENSLLSLDGIIEVNVNLSAEKAFIVYNPNILTPEEMKDAIEETGYQFLGIEGEETEDLEKILREKDLKEKCSRIMVGFATGILLIILMYFPINFPFPLAYLMLFVSAPVFIYISYPIFKAAYRSLKNRNLNMDVMYSMGIGVAFIASLLATFEFILSRNFLFYETAIFLATFLTMGRYLEARAKGKTSDAIKKLIALQPKKAGVLRFKNINIEILYFRDYPHHDKAVEQVKDALKELNISVPINSIEVNKENYQEYFFFGSPTILINKRDLEGKIDKTLNRRFYDYNHKNYSYPPKDMLISKLLSFFEEQEISREKIKINDLLVVKPGEKIPVDGEVIDGESYLDESMITGEPIPTLKEKGDKVIGGTINKNGVIRFKATKIGRDTVLSQIIKLVEIAQGSKPPIQRIADKAVSYFIPLILAIAVFSFVIWYLILGNTLLFALTSLISVLVIACPCALGLATPTAVTVGVGRGAELGVLIKNGEVLEISEKLNTIVFDKTGTLTKGRPEVTDIIGIGIEDLALLKLVASVERNSKHPLAEAIVKKSIENDLELLSSESFNTFRGKGVVAKVEGKEILIGNKTLLKDKNISLSREVEKNIFQLENEGKTVMLIAFDNKMMGVIAITDTLKETTKAAIKEFRNMKFNIFMITGDNIRTAKVIAKQAGIENVLAEVLPQDKANEVKKLQDKGNIVAFVGDGINDAPALAQADVGIAIGSGTDIAIESGEIVLIKDDLLDAVAAVQLSKKIISRIKQNIFWAFAYNTVLIPVAAGILYPFFRITFRPEFAGLAMAMSSVTVVSLSLMLKRYIPPVKKITK